MMNTFGRIAFCLGVLAMCTGLAGCAVEKIPYPKLSSVKKLTSKIMSRGEQEEAIRALTAEQLQHQQSAIQQIESSK